MGRTWLILKGFLILGTLGYILYSLDRKRISDPHYKFKVQKERKKMKLKKEEKLKYQLLAFPASNNIIDIKNFVIREIEKGEECMVHKNYDQAVIHLSNGLSLTNNSHSLMNIIQKNVPPKIYTQIIEKIQDIQIMLPELIKLKV